MLGSFLVIVPIMRKHSMNISHCERSSSRYFKQAHREQENLYMHFIIFNSRTCQTSNDSTRLWQCQRERRTNKGNPLHCTFLLLPLLFRHILMVFNNACHNKLVGDGCTFWMQTFSEFCSNIIRITFAEPMRVYLVSYVCGNRKAMVSKSDSASISIHVFDRVTSVATSTSASGNIIT